jgi:hypothetical protein
VTYQAVFVDRDGTLGGDGHFHRPTAFVPFPCTQLALAMLRGVNIFVFTNQHRMSRGEATESEFVAEATALGRDGAYVCPHAANGGSDCRKTLIAEPSRVVTRGYGEAYRPTAAMGSRVWPPRSHGRSRSGWRGGGPTPPRRARRRLPERRLAGNSPRPHSPNTPGPAGRIHGNELLTAGVPWSATCRVRREIRAPQAGARKTGHGEGRLGFSGSASLPMARATAAAINAQVDHPVAPVVYGYSGE